jgi:predicted  nucleic acid-binding Zn-ribbon protein
VNPSVPEIKRFGLGLVTSKEIEELLPSLAKSDKLVISLRARITELRERQSKLRKHFPEARKSMREKLLKQEIKNHNIRIKAIPKKCDEYILGLKEIANQKSRAINRRVGLQLMLIARRERELRGKAARIIKAGKQAKLKAQGSSDKDRLVVGVSAKGITA